MHKAVLRASCGWFPAGVVEVGMAIVDDDIESWCTYENGEPQSCGSLPWHPELAVETFAHELVALHRFDRRNAHLIAEDLYHRLQT